MWSASSPCPHASWKRIPPLPDAMTSGTSPLGAGRADKLDDRPARRGTCELLHVARRRTARSRWSVPRSRDRSASRCRPPPRTRPRSGCAPGRRRRAVRRSSQRGPGAGCRRTRRTPGGPTRLSPAPPRPPAARSSILRVFSTASARSSRPGRSCDERSDRVGPPSRATAAAARAAARRPASVSSAVWANPVVSPTTTRMPAPRSRAEESSSTRPSSRTAPGRVAVLCEHLGELAALLERRAEHPLHDIGIDERLL